MKQFSIFIFLLLLSCKNDRSPSGPEIENKTHRYDTKLIEMYIDELEKDTIFRFDIDDEGKILAPDGLWMVYYDTALTKKFFQEEIREGESVGHYVRWYPNGNKLWEGFRAGKIDTGFFRTWYPGGQLKSERYYKNDSVIGSAYEFFESGELKSETCFDNNEISKIYNYNKSRDTISTVYYKLQKINSSYCNYPYFEIEYKSPGTLLHSYVYVLDSTENDEKTIKVYTYKRVDVDSVGI